MSNRVTKKATGGGGGTPGGSNNSIQFNNSGAFGGIPASSWNGSTLLLPNAAFYDSYYDANIVVAANPLYGGIGMAQEGVTTGIPSFIPSWYSSGGFWLNMPTDGPSGIGSGGPGTNPWIAYSSSYGQWFNIAQAGDINYRNLSGNLNFGNTEGSPVLRLTKTGSFGIDRALFGGTVTSGDDGITSLQTDGFNITNYSQNSGVSTQSLSYQYGDANFISTSTVYTISSGTAVDGSYSVAGSWAGYPYFKRSDNAYYIFNDPYNWGGYIISPVLGDDTSPAIPLWQSDAYANFGIITPWGTYTAVQGSASGTPSISGDYDFRIGASIGSMGGINTSTGDITGRTITTYQGASFAGGGITLGATTGSQAWISSSNGSASFAEENFAIDLYGSLRAKGYLIDPASNVEMLNLTAYQSWPSGEGEAAFFWNVSGGAFGLGFAPGHPISVDYLAQPGNDAVPAIDLTGAGTYGAWQYFDSGDGSVHFNNVWQNGNQVIDSGNIGSQSVSSAAYASGAGYAQTLTGGGTILPNDGGSGLSAGGNLSWDTAGNLNANSLTVASSVKLADYTSIGLPIEGQIAYNFTTHATTYYNGTIWV